MPASEDPAGSAAFGLDLAAFIGNLRSADTHGRTFQGPGRGGHLPDHDEWMQVCFRNSVDSWTSSIFRPCGLRCGTLPEVEPDVMSHGDLTPPNVLVGDGRLAGVLDGGGFAPADPALDLVSAWHLLDEPVNDPICGRRWGAARCSGGGGWPGPSSSRWDWSGTTPNPIRR